ncbi:MAG: oligosaccharide flippase family protein [Flavobacteriales bacterium]|nr:oligosaccharide flippase family protein [Flavobacteriales bacterium]
MQRKFLSNLILVVVLNLLVKPFYILGIDAEVQNRVGEVVYGNYFSLLNFSFLLNILLDFGLTNYNTRNIAQHPHLIEKHFYKILSLRFVLFFLYASVTLGAGLFVGYSGKEFYLLSILMLNQFLVAIIQFCRSNFAGLHLFRTDSFISILDRFLLILICSVLLWTSWFGGEMKIEWFVYAQTAAYGISALISLLMLIPKVGKIKPDIKKTFSAVILRKSFPYALLILLMMFYSRIDAVMLERLLEDGDYQAGVYAQGFRLLDAVSMFALLFAGLLLPIFSTLIKKKESVAEMLELAFRILLGISLTVAMIGFLYQGDLIHLRYPTAPENSAITFGYLILSFIPISLGYVFGTLLTANGSLRYLNGMAIFGLVLNVVLNFIFIRLWKAEGAALATLITQSTTVLLQIIFAYRIFKLKINFKLYGAFILFTGLLFGAYWLLTEQSSLPVFITLLTLLGLAAVSGFVFGIFKISDIRTILKKEENA